MQDQEHSTQIGLFVQPLVGHPEVKMKHIIFWSWSFWPFWVPFRPCPSFLCGPFHPLDGGSFPFLASSPLEKPPPTPTSYWKKMLVQTAWPFPKPISGRNQKHHWDFWRLGCLWALETTRWTHRLVLWTEWLVQQMLEKPETKIQ